MALIARQNQQHQSTFSELLTPTSTASQPSSMAQFVAQEFVCDWPTAHTRADSFLVLRFDDKGKHSYLELSRSDILRIIRLAEASPFERVMEPPPPTKERPGSVVSPLGTYCDLQPVHMRDLRQLDESFSEENETEIIVRKQAILINADPIRCILTRNETLVFVPDGADSLLLMLINDFNECVTKETHSSTAYELRALEALLDTLTRRHDQEYERRATEVNDALKSFLNVNIMAGELETMRLMKNSMVAFQAQVDSLRRALMEILDNEEDLRLLYLTKLHENPSLIYDLGSFDPEKVEILLESYLKDIYTTRTKSELLQHRIQTAESLITMKLDYARNYLLALQLIFSLVGVALGVGTLVSGIFGMNLKIDAPTNTVATFWWVTGAILVGCVAVIVGGVAYFRHQGVAIAL